MRKGKLIKTKEKFDLIYSLDVVKNGRDMPIYAYGTSNFDDFSKSLKYLKHYMDNDFSIIITIGNEKRTYPLTSDFQIIDFSKTA